MSLIQPIIWESVYFLHGQRNIFLSYSLSAILPVIALSSCYIAPHKQQAACPQDIKTDLNLAYGKQSGYFHCWLWWTGTSENGSGGTESKKHCFAFLCPSIHALLGLTSEDRRSSFVNFPIEHLSVLFIGVTKGMLILPGFLLTYFSPLFKRTVETTMHASLVT